MKRNKVLGFVVLLTLAGTAWAEKPDDIFIIGATSKSPEAAVAAIKSYTEKKKWVYLGASKVKKGAVRLVKICIPEVGRLIWPVGLELSALLPCGNVGVYKKGAATEISILHPRYMHVLYPHPATERASAAAEPLLTEMLRAITRKD